MSPSAEALRAALAANPALLASPQRARVDVIVPVFNALDQTARCLESVARHTHTPFRLIVINDGSSNPDVTPFLDAINRATENVWTINREQNQGFVRTVNQGFSLSPVHDVVLLNSDTRVTHDWLSKLLRAASTRPHVATVTPLTNNGTICSVPTPFETNEIPFGYDVDGFGRLVETLAFRLYPEVPTGVGFCMLITRAALDAVGPFDADAFPRGYGEENDFCQRAIGAGFLNLIADDTFVFHEGGSSFGEATRALLERNLREVARRHPNYLRDVEAVCQAHPLRPFHDYLRRSIAASRTGEEPLRVLHVLHEGGGTEKHARDLAADDAPGVLSYVLRSNGRRFSIDEYHHGQWLRSLRFPLSEPVGETGVEWHTGYASAFATVCWSLRINLIHVHHLKHNALDIGEIAGSMGIPYVMTLHDYYMLCPGYTLLTGDDRLCAECRSGRTGSAAEACMERVGKTGVDLLEYQGQSRLFMQGARALFVPNPAVIPIFAERFPELAARMRVIEHGHDEGWKGASPSRRVMSASDPDRLDVAVIGGLERHKGLAVFRNLLRVNSDDRLVFHLYGTTPDSDINRLARNMETRLDRSRFIYHGPYQSNEIVSILVDDGIDVGLQPAIWPETFSYTLSELVEANIPVIAGDFGAQGERIRRCCLGWTVPDIHDAEAVLAILRVTADDRGRLRDAREGMNRVAALRSRRDMWRDYVDVYKALASRDAQDSAGSGHPNESAPSKEYVVYLATQLADTLRPATAASPPPAENAELHWLRERLRSPRHRIADRVADSAQKIPVLWPMLARVTEMCLRWERNRQSRRASSRPAER